ncbi:AMP-dependent synthetase/ligase [Cinnamomum micranthum f. kanehirae]|uniref:Long-chain-fatty-acid--CoA ligase n=1 Tax=Cinnamomum micranthum f. kanehirae TaxID=337451 RepID=A0A3S3R4T3_9MAGN|nr:AMP-dependent synthetase/ligase [Cinnamomum micranthum f. kanehirae]
MDSAAQRRLKAIQDHLVSPNIDHHQLMLRANETAGEFAFGQGYSVVLPEKLQTGKWNVYRSAHSPLKLVSRFSEHPDIGTLHDNFVHAIDTFRDFKYLGTRVRVDGTVGEYKWMTYGEAGTARAAIGSALIYHGVPKGSCIGLYFVNRPEWIIVDHACSAYSYISVPLYDTLGPDAVKYVVDHANVQAIFCVPVTLNTLLSFLSEMPSVRLVVVVGGIDEHLPSLPTTAGVKIMSYSKLLYQGQSNLQQFSPPTPDDTATICYTSGTTGTPKGAVLTHGNLIANVAGSNFLLKFYPSDIYISYLPLAHIYERVNQILMAYYGVAIGFYQGDNLKLMDDMAALRPTLFCSVPRLYNRIYDGITNAVKASGGLRERLFNAAFNAKKQAIMKGKNPSPMWDRLVFNKIKEKLGGRVRFMGSGASPLSPDVMDFLRICFSVNIIEGYGMTESSCIISAMDDGDKLSGHVGSPNPACEIKLVDVPEMNYTSDDQPHPRGEICLRGPIVFKGYYKDAVQTKEAIDEEGEYIAPEKIENVYVKCKFIAQCFIYGDSLNSSLVAVVSVDEDNLKAWAASGGIKYNHLAQLCSDPRARAAVLAEMDAVGREAQLRGFEFAKAVTLVPEPFSMENGLLTPTFKIKRPQAKAYFAKEISDMYAELSVSDSVPHKTL